MRYYEVKKDGVVMSVTREKEKAIAYGETIKPCEVVTIQTEDENLYRVIEFLEGYEGRLKKVEQYIKILKEKE